MTTDDLTAHCTPAPLDCSPSKAGTALLISNGTFLHRDDFTSRFIQHGTSCGTPMAAIDWDAAIAALPPANPLLRRRTPNNPAVSQPRSRHPVSLGDTVTGLDDANVSRLLTAIRHAAGERP